VYGNLNGEATMAEQAMAGMVPLLALKVFEHPLLAHVYDKVCHDHVEEGMSDLFAGLRDCRLQSTDEIWADFVRMCLRHPLRSLLHQDPFTWRAFAKPRGYSGDAELLDFIYGRDEAWPVPGGTTEVGRRIFDFTTRRAACEGVRARRDFIAELLDQLAEEFPRPHVLSVAAGHLREALRSSAVRRGLLGRYLALDSDRDSLREVERCFGDLGVETVAATIRQALTGRIQLGLFDLVYSTGLYDYVSQPTAQRLTLTLFQMLRPRGRLCVANFLPGISDQGYMETYMDWKLIYRTRQEMVALADEIPQAAIRDLRIFAEENQNIIFLEITRR
jgi:extracellular factor (EF) 3-hydroxypalmitic acid methyl ester biosynthesis protein